MACVALRTRGEQLKLAALWMEQELFDEEPGEAFGIVTDDAVFFEQVVGHKLDLQFSNAFGIDANRLGTLRAVTLGNFQGDRSDISNNGIDHALLHVILDGANVLAEGVAVGFAAGLVRLRRGRCAVNVGYRSSPR